jgi:hypothetical protein
VAQSLADDSTSTSARARVLCEGGYPFTPGQVSRVVQYMDFASASDKDKLYHNVARVGFLAGHPLITPRLMASGDPEILVSAALSAGGRVWAGVVSRLAPIGVPMMIESVRSLLEKTTPAQVRELTAADLVPLVGSSDEKVRILALGLMKGVLPARSSRPAL